MGKLKKETETLTEEKILEVLNASNSKQDVFRYFKLSGGPTDYKDLKELCDKIGFDIKKLDGNENKKVKRICQNCGKPLRKGQYKFCCRSCSITASNQKRKKHKKEEKIKKERPYKQLSKEQLEYMLFVEKKSYHKIAQAYGTGYRQIRHHALTLGIDISTNSAKNEKEPHYCKFCGEKIQTTGKKFCSQYCANEYRKAEKYADYLNHQEEFSDNEIKYEWLKPHILNEQNNKCAICDCIPMHNGKELHFVMDHIDGNARNNKRDNLRMICPNCDSQLDTYKARNIGKSTRNYLPYSLRKKQKN